VIEILTLILLVVYTMTLLIVGYHLYSYMDRRFIDFYITCKKIEKSIETRMIIKTFEFIKEIVETIRRIQTKDKVDLNDIFVDIHVPTEYYISDTKGYEYVNEIEKHLKGFFKKINFYFTPTHLDLDIKYKNIFHLSNKGKVAIYSFYFPKKPQINVEKLKKEIEKIKKELSNEHYVKNNTNEFIKSKHELLIKKENELKMEAM